MTVSLHLPALPKFLCNPIDLATVGVCLEMVHVMNTALVETGGIRLCTFLLIMRAAAVRVAYSVAVTQAVQDLFEGTAGFQL